jgi:hypothetical protein
MKIVIGHKVLNLEELTYVAFLGKDLAEVVIDSQLYAELSTANPSKTMNPTFNALTDDEQESSPLLLSRQ